MSLSQLCGCLGLSGPQCGTIIIQFVSSCLVFSCFAAVCLFEGVTSLSMQTTAERSHNATTTTTHTLNTHFTTQPCSSLQLQLQT